MAKDNQEYERISIYSQRNPKTGEYDIPLYEKDAKNIINNAIKSALPKDAFIEVANKKVYKSGRERVDVYIHKEDMSPAVEQSIGTIESQLTFDGTSPRYKIIHPVPASRTVTDELRKQENAPEVHAYVKQKEREDKLKEKEEAQKQRELDKQQAQKTKELEREEKQKLKEKEDEKKEVRGIILKILGVTTILTDVTRRILTSVLTFASQAVRDSITAHNLNMSYEDVRGYRLAEIGHGLKEGTIVGGVEDVQSKFGNITKLDEKALEDLAVVMGNKVNEMVNVATSEQNPEEALGMIIDAFNERANSGYNSVGQYVGEANARRELYSYLLKLSPQWADIFATMQEEQHNINSLFRNQADTFKEWKGLTSSGRGNDSDARQGVVVSLGEQWNVFKSTWEAIKQSLMRDIAPTLLTIMRFLSGLDIGMTESEKLRLSAENYTKNAEYIKATKATIKDMESLGEGNLTVEQKARLKVLKRAVAEAEKENEGGWDGKRKIHDKTLLPNEEQVYTEIELEREATAKVVTASHSNTKNKSNTAIILGDTSYIPEARERIGEILDNLPQYKASLQRKYDAESKASLMADSEKIKEKQEAEEEKYQQLVAPYQRHIEDWKNEWLTANSDEQRLELAKREAKKAVANPYKYKIPSEASQIGYTQYYENVYALGQLYGIDFFHDEKGNPIPTLEITDRILGRGKYEKEKPYYNGDLFKKLKLKKLGRELDERVMPEVPPDIANIPEEQLRAEAKAYADELYPDADVSVEKAFPPFLDWAYDQDRFYINNIAEKLIAEEQAGRSGLDPFRIIQLLRHDYSYDLGGINAKTGVTYPEGTSATLSSRNVKEGSENRYIVDFTVHSKDGDKTFTLVDTYGIKGAGGNVATLTASGDGWELQALNGQGMSNSQAQGD